MLRHRYLWLLLVVLPVPAGASDLTDLAHRHVWAAPLYSTSLDLTAGVPVTIETHDSALFTDPVIHLWDSDSGIEIGHDDDGGGAPEARLTVVPPTTGTYRLIVRASDENFSGTSDVWVDGEPLHAGVPISGYRALASPDAAFYETVLDPDGAQGTVLLGIDCDGALVGVDVGFGVGSSALLPMGGNSICEVVLASLAIPFMPGFASLYGNDFETDGDMDGLSAALEQEIGTCDPLSDSPPWWCNSAADFLPCEDEEDEPYCGMPGHPWDSDRDGLRDGDELLGVIDDESPLPFPRWGADPLHKDVFVEVDWREEVGGSPMSDGTVAAIQAFFDAGPSGDLQNPDGEDGVRVHIDTWNAFSPYSEAGEVPNGIDRFEGWAEHMDPARRPFFHYALATRGNGSGQGTTGGKTLDWATSLTDGHPESFAHELGHNLGLEHWGHDSWGRANCKPNYPSLMNYGNPANEPAFSIGSYRNVLNPSSVDEWEPFGPETWTGFLEDDPFWYGTVPPHVDFNDDWKMAAPWVERPRTAVTFADAGCGAFNQNAQILGVTADEPSTPSLVLHDDRLFALWGARATVMVAQATPTGPNAQGSCVDDEDGEACLTWGQTNTTNGASFGTITSVSGASFGGRLLIASGTDDGNVFIVRSQLGSTSLTAPSLVATGNTGAVHLTPAWTPDGLELALFTLDEDGLFHWRTTAHAEDDTQWLDRGSVITDSGSPLRGVLGAALIPWPDADPIHENIGTTCGAFPLREGAVRLYCLDPVTEQWDMVNMPHGARGLPTVVKPGLAWHVERDDDGSPLHEDGVGGRFWVSGAYFRNDNYPSVPFVRTSVFMDANSGPLDLGDDDGFPQHREAPMGGIWTTVLSGVALVDDPQLSAMKALWIRKDDRLSKDWGGADVPIQVVEFLPFADGTFDRDLMDGSDFQVMEHGICSSIQSLEFCDPVGHFGITVVLK